MTAVFTRLVRACVALACFNMMSAAIGLAVPAMVAPTIRAGEPALTLSARMPPPARTLFHVVYSCHGVNIRCRLTAGLTFVVRNVIAAELIVEP